MNESGNSDTTHGKHGHRAGWGSKLEFFVAMLGTCVGLGNVWRFPYRCFKNGGGAFLIPYFIMMALIGLPLFYMETAWGQFGSLSSIAIFKMIPLFKGLGYGILLVVSFIALYYNVLNAQFLYYIFLSMREPVPWSKCYDYWNPTPCCLDCQSVNDTDCAPYNRNLSETQNCTKLNFAAEEFYNNYVLQISDGIDNFGYPVWQILLCLLAVWIIITAVLFHGAKSFGKVAYFTALFPYVMLITMLIRGVTLEGSEKGILYLLTPQFDKLLDLVVWQEAAGQVFFSVSVACGQTITLSSYNNFKHPIYRDSVLVVVLDAATSLLSGFVVFSVLGYMSVLKDIPIEDVAAAGPGLVFEVYPSALATMSLSPLWSILFFVMMLTLGFGSGFSQCETIQSALLDEFPKVFRKTPQREKLLRVAICVTLFLLAIPMTCNGGMYLLHLIDESTGTFALLFIGLAESLVIPYVYGWKRFCDDIQYMTGVRPNMYLVICWTIVAPVLLIFLLVANLIRYQEPIYDEIYVYPSWAIALGVVIMVLPILAMPIWAVYYAFHYMKVWTILKEASKPMVGWGPAKSDDYQGYMSTISTEYKFQSTQNTIEAYSAALLESSSDSFEKTSTKKAAMQVEIRVNGLKTFDNASFSFNEKPVDADNETDL